MPIDINALSVMHDDLNRRFVVLLEDDVALIEYSIDKNRIIFFHTEVPPPYEGKGIAALMTKTALDYARENNLKVISLCSYISRYISRHPVYQELQQVMD